MYRKDNHYYVAYACEGEKPRDEMDHVSNGSHIVRNDFADYETALACAKQSHKEENRRGPKDFDIMDTYVMKTEKGYMDYPVAVISGWGSRVEEIKYLGGIRLL